MSNMITFLDLIEQQRLNDWERRRIEYWVAWANCWSEFEGASKSTRLSDVIIGVYNLPSVFRDWLIVDCQYYWDMRFIAEVRRACVGPIGIERSRRHQVGDDYLCTIYCLDEADGVTIKLMDAER